MPPFPFPWSSRREMLYLALQEHITKSGDLLAAIENPLDFLPALEKHLAPNLAAGQHADEVIQWSRFARDAARVFYLASHDQPQLQAHASLDALQAAADEWADQHLDEADLVANVRAALALRTEHKEKIVIPRPEKPASAEKPGN